jgi:uncharacterized protein DUF3574
MTRDLAVDVEVCIMAAQKGDVMWRLIRAVTMAGIILSVGCGVTEPPRMDSAVGVADSVQPCAPLGTAYMRTTLYFGLARPTGMVSEAEWQTFLREDVTPRFPDGLTVLEGDGQWRRPDGTIGREHSKVLVILHDDKPSTHEALQALVMRYKQVFAQQSVLWEIARVCAAF